MADFNTPTQETKSALGYFIEIDKSSRASNYEGKITPYTRTINVADSDYKNTELATTSIADYIAGAVSRIFGQFAHCHPDPTFNSAISEQISALGNKPLLEYK